MSKNQKLELTWIGKEKRPRLEPRILLEDPEKSYHAKFKNPPLPLGKPPGSGITKASGEGSGVRETDIFDNRLIFGDNLLALKALEQEFTGQVKCVFIDPPYNTGSAFTHYDDGLEHSIWLGLMRDRLEIIRRLLSEDGSLWITIDDNEAHYLKVRGGFRYYRLAPTLITNDRWGNPVVNPEYNAAMLAEALCKLEGFTYAPSETRWWQHGHSSERDFIYVTTQNLSAEQLQALSDELGVGANLFAQAQSSPDDGRINSPLQSLLVCCSAFHGVGAAQAAERWPNLTVKKIPKMVLARCEWGHDDYSLNVANLPMAQPEPDRPSLETAQKPRTTPGQLRLFEEDTE